MEWASNFIAEIYKYLNERDDTGIDRLNRLYTVALLSAFVTLISSQQYIVGGRIVCWTPKDFSGPQISYVNDLCWLGQTNYYIPENLTILESPSSTRDHPFVIYPWLPIILIGMTVSFVVPYLLIWHGLSTRSGIDIKRLMNLNKNEDLSSAIHFILFKKYSIKQTGGIYVISIYLLTKIFYIINLIGQIILINKLLLGDYFKFNIQHIYEILSVKYNMWSSPHFPIETMCGECEDRRTRIGNYLFLYLDFMVRMLGENNNWYTIQCILPFNLFTKRIFALLIIWFIILLVLNLIDLIYIWIWKRLWLSSRRYNYILSLFNLYEMHLCDNNRYEMIIITTNDQRFCQEFVYNYLGIDGYLLLKFLHTKLSDIKMSYLVINLVDRFFEARRQRSKQIRKYNNNTVL